MTPLLQTCPELEKHAELPEIHYVVGFVFDCDLRKVVLIRKCRPAHLAGKLNGPGGKVEAGETALQAMVREMKEETDLQIAPEDWRAFATGRGVEADLSARYRIDFFTAVSPIEAAVTLTDEAVVFYLVSEIAYVRRRFDAHLGRVAWLVALALAHLQHDQPAYVTICY